MVNREKSQGIKVKEASLVSESGCGQGFGGDWNICLCYWDLTVEQGPGQAPFWSPGMLKSHYQTIVPPTYLHLTITKPNYKLTLQCNSFVLITS